MATQLRITMRMNRLELMLNARGDEESIDIPESDPAVALLGVVSKMV